MIIQWKLLKSASPDVPNVNTSRDAVEICESNGNQAVDSDRAFKKESLVLSSEGCKVEERLVSTKVPLLIKGTKQDISRG